LVSTAFYLGKEKLRHSLGRPSRSDFVQFQFDGQMIYRKNVRIDKRQVVMYVTSIKDYLLFYEKIVNWLSTA